MSVVEPYITVRYDSGMLKHRVLFGALLYFSLAVVLFLDNRFDQADIEGTIWQTLFLQRQSLPPGLLLFVVFLVLIAMAASELCNIFWAKGIKVGRFMVVASAMAGCAAMYIVPFCQGSLLSMATIATLPVIVFLAALFDYSFRRQRVQGAVAVAAATLFAMVYLGLAPGFYVSLRLTHSTWVIAGIIVVTKFGDCGAYFIGRLIGRHKLIPWLSPHKTWEGLAGAVVIAMLTSVMVAWGLYEFQHAWPWQIVHGNQPPRGVALRYPLLAAAIAGVVLGVVGHVGDLVASLLKRDAGVKDFGNTVPGFGGLIDLFDSPIVVAPAAFWMLHLAAQVG